MFVEPQREYEGYFFAASETGATVRVSLYNRDSNSSLGEALLKIPGGGSAMKFSKMNFSITTAAGALCTAVIRCAGEFRLEVVGTGAVNFDFVFLQPGEWGRFKGLPVLKSGADLLLKMGIRSMRVGGSFAGHSPWYEWHRWTGPIWKRQS
eukprot:SAG31_NODE_24366_length_483_cov_0.776042_1_plen_150_part_01